MHIDEKNIMQVVIGKASLIGRFSIKIKHVEYNALPIIKYN